MVLSTWYCQYEITLLWCYRSIGTNWGLGLAAIPYPTIGLATIPYFGGLVAINTVAFRD